MSIAALQNYLEGHGVDHFTATEITLLRSWGKNYVPPEELWENALETLSVAEVVRDAWGAVVDNPRIRVNSGIRSAEYNKYVGGKEASEHLQFKALDISPMNGMISKFKLVVVSVVAALRHENYNIGLGLYDTFIHIDTNAANKQVNRTWDLQT